MADMKNTKGRQTAGAPASKTPEKVVPQEPEVQSPDAKILITIADDEMSAKVMLEAPQPGGKKPSRAMFDKAFSDNGVIYGIKEEYVERLLQYPIYGATFMIANGRLAENGHDGELVCLFSSDDTLAPQILEDGTADYKNMGFGHSVQEGEVVANITPPSKGEDGYTVTGKRIEGKNGAVLSPSPNGANTVISQDGTQVIASCPGNISLKDKKVHVRKEMNIIDVDQTTGNIVFAGDVVISGDVKDGFLVKSGGNITVGGVVENASLIAEGDIVVKTGIHGEDCVVQAGGGIRTAYIEMGDITAKTCIYADVVLNAKLKSDEKVVLAGKRGCFIGGVAHVGYYMEAKVIGNEANVATSVVISPPKEVNPETAELNEAIKECTERVALLSDEWRAATTQNLPPDIKKEKVSKLVLARRSAEAELRELTTKLAQVTPKMESDSKSLLIVHEHIFPNVSITLDELAMRNTFLRPACRVTRVKDKILFGTHT